MKKKPHHPNYRKPPRPAPAELLDFEITDDLEYVILPLFVRPCDLLRTWAAARKEADA
jgi:hypothetical protein